MHTQFWKMLNSLCLSSSQEKDSRELWIHSYQCSRFRSEPFLRRSTCLAGCCVSLIQKAFEEHDLCGYFKGLCPLFWKMLIGLQR